MSVSVHDIYSSAFYLALYFFVSILSPFASSEHHSVSLRERKERGRKKKNLIALTNKVSWDRQPTQGRMFHGDSERETEQKWACETLVAPLHLRLTSAACLSAATQEGFCSFKAAQPFLMQDVPLTQVRWILIKLKSILCVWYERMPYHEWPINWTRLVNLERPSGLNNTIRDNNLPFIYATIITHPRFLHVVCMGAGMSERLNQRYF